MTASESDDGERNRRTMTTYRPLNRTLYPLYFLAPGASIYLIFFALPFFVGLYFSFFRWDFFSAEFIALENYRSILSNPDLRIAIGNTLYFAGLTTVLKVGLGLALAIFLNRSLRTKNFLRSIYYLPAILNVVAVGIVFSAILHPTLGLLNRFLHAVGLSAWALHWLTDRAIAMTSLSVIEVWQWVGFTMVILLAGLQTISREYYEAAALDGASPWHKFVHITLPLIMPALNNAIIISLIGGLKVFALVATVTQGGPGRRTEVINTVVYESFVFNRQGEAAAGTVVLSLIIVAISLSTYLFISKREVEV